MAAGHADACRMLRRDWLGNKPVRRVPPARWHIPCTSCAGHRFASMKTPTAGGRTCRSHGVPVTGNQKKGEGNRFRTRPRVREGRGWKRCRQPPHVAHWPGQQSGRSRHRIGSRPVIHPIQQQPDSGRKRRTDTRDDSYLCPHQLPGLPHASLLHVKPSLHVTPPYRARHRHR